MELCTSTTQIAKVKYNDEEIVPSVHKKSNKELKSKKRKTKKKEKHKKRKRYLSSCSESDEFEWVEKKIADQSSHNTKNELEREEWMTVENFLPCVSKFDMRKQKSSVEEDKIKILLNKPGQSNRELNPYWKNGGDGLPQNSPGRFDNSLILDADWLKKSLWRAEEQALRDSKSLEEIAVERWGSLEIIQSMIAKAEKMRDMEPDKLYNKKHDNDRNNKDLHRIPNSGTKRHLISRSQNKGLSRKYSTSDYPSWHIAQKQTYQKPKDNDDYYQQIVHKPTNIKKWRKDEGDDGKHESEFNVENLNTNEVDNSKGSNTLTEAEMNKLGARIIKAELMDDNELAAQLKIQLEQARKLVTKNTNMQDVILMRTDAKGVARPIQPRNQSKQFEKTHKRKKTIETHISGERVRHFLDDDKYSLQEIFQQEKTKSTSEDEAMFTKLVSTNVNSMNDVFEQHIGQTNLREKQDKQDRTRAIKEHKKLSKCIDNCWWCLDSKNMLKHMIVTMDSMICLSLPAYVSLTTGHCILTPIQHIACQLQLDEDAWDKLKEFKRKIIKMFLNEDFYPIFFEVYKKRQKFSHMQIECIPLPKDIGESAPIYFKKALLECETEWSLNKKIVDLKSEDLRRTIPNGLSYFVIEFASHPGYAHIIENEELFPKKFAEEIIGGMLDLDCNLWRKLKKQNFDEQKIKVLEFTKIWKKHNSPESK